MRRGFLVTRGLGCKGLVVTRGLGKCQISVIVEQPTQLRTNIRKGASSRRKEDRQQIDCYFVKAQLVFVNDKEVFDVIGQEKITFLNDDISIRTSLPSSKKIERKILIKARYMNGTSNNKS